MTKGYRSQGTRGLWNRAFVLLCVFYFLTFVAGYQLFPVVPLHLRNMGAGLAESGRYMSAFTLGSALGALFTGPLGDRLGQRRVLLSASLLSVVFFVAYAFMPVRWGFYVLAPLHGLVWSGLRTASVAKAGSMLEPENRAQGMTFFGLASPAGVAVGPVLGLALFPIFGFSWVMLTLGGAFLVLHFLSRGLPHESSNHRRVESVYQLPEIHVLTPACILFCIGVSFGPIPPFSAQEAKHLSLVWPSALLSSLACGIVGLRLILGTKGMGHRPIRLLPAMLWICILALTALALAPGGTIRHVLAGAFYGAGYGMVHTLLFTHIIDISSPNRRGASVGALYFSYDAGQAVGALGLGWVMDFTGRIFGQAWGYRCGWSLGALILLPCLWLAFRVLRESTSAPRYQ